MTITNGYATLAEIRALKEITSTDPPDDVFLERLIERASRACDNYCGQLGFYAAANLTRSFDQPRRGRVLELDAPLLSITRLTNGDEVVIDSSEYKLWPYNGPHKSEIRLKQGSTIIWQPDTSNNSEGVITVQGTWGYVDRTATDPESKRVISNTTEACLAIALAVYLKRHGLGTDGVARVTAAGVVITPQGIPAEAKELLAAYVRLL